MKHKEEAKELTRKTELQGKQLGKEKRGKCIQIKIIYENDYQKVLICFPPRMDQVQKVQATTVKPRQIFCWLLKQAQGSLDLKALPRRRRFRINRLLSPLRKGGCPRQLVPTPSSHAKKLHPYLRKCPRALWRNAVTQLSCLPSRSPPKPQLQLKCCLSFLLALYNQSNSTGPRSSLLSTPFPYKHLLLVFLSACGRKGKRVPRCNKFESVSQRGLLVAPSRGLLILLLINPC